MPVDRAAGGREHDLAHAMPAGGVGDADGADDVQLRVVHRVGDGLADVDLRGEMEDHLGAHALEQLVPVDGEDVGLDELEAVGAGRPRALQVGELAVRQVVDDGHRMSIRQQPVDQRRPDEPGAPGHQRTAGRKGGGGGGVTHVGGHESHGTPTARALRRPRPGTSASSSEMAGDPSGRGQPCGSPRRELSAMTAAMSTAMTMPPPSMTGYVIHSMAPDSSVRIAGNAKPM